MSTLGWQHVSSSNINAVDYDADNQIVLIRFINGTVYAYKGVPEHEFENLRSASSVGSYLNRNYKNVYPYERVS